jgi:hypothetical protein
MALVLKDRVKETTTTTGTGTITLDGAAVGFQSFSVIGDGNQTYYTINDVTDYEVGIGTYTASGTTLSRDVILESSNSGSAVNWGAGVKDVFVTYPAEKASTTFPAVPKTANYTAAINEGVLTDTTGGAFTVTLPASPITGAVVVVSDAGGDWGDNNLTIGRNSATIAGVAQDLVCDISGISVQLVYDGTTWLVFAQVGAASGGISAVTSVDTGTGLTGGPITTTGTISVATNGITNALLRQSTGLSLIGRSANTTGDVADITAGTDNQVLRRSGTSVGFGAVNLASSDAVTGDLPYSNLVQGSALSVLGVTGNATADNASIAAGTDYQVLRRSGTSVAFGSIDLSQAAAITGTLPVANGGTGITSFGTGVATFLGTPSSANLAAAVTDETGSGLLVFATSPTLTTPVLGTPTSGTLSNCTVDGTDAVGFRTIPQNSQSAAYTLVLADSGKHILHPSADTTARTFTIPANSSVAYPIGTAITFINQNGAGVVTIDITTDTMRLSPAGTTGSRTLAANGIATCIKLTSTEWIISGTGLT